MSIDAMKQALEALEEVVYWYQCRDKNDKPMPIHNQNPEIKMSIEAITALRAAIEQAQEPVVLNGGRLTQYPDGSIGVGTPAKPDQWQGLTDEEIWSDGSTMDLSEDGIRNFARAIEAKLKEKNT